MGVTYLLDTHVLLWLLGDPGRVPARSGPSSVTPATGCLVSAACALEVATKVRLGKLDARALVDTWPERLLQLGAEELPVSGQARVLAGSPAVEPPGSRSTDCSSPRAWRRAFSLVTTDAPHPGALPTVSRRLTW